VPSIPALIEPSVLAWARTSANLEPIAAARKIGVVEDELRDWEKGKSYPTIAQLRKAATAYHRPLAVFFLPEPPKGFNTLRDFRRVAEQLSSEWSAALHAEYRRAHAQRDVLLELAELEDEAPARDWQLPVPDGDEALAEAAREHLRGQTSLRFPSPGADKFRHLGYWTNALEEAGVLVMATERSRVPVDEMRGFSLYFDEVPVIMLNGADAPRGRMFSLLHEYVHLLLHTEGLCDTTTDMRSTTPDRAIEAHCNAVAAAILMPRQAVLSSSLVARHKAGEAWALSELIDAAKPFGVSVEAFLRRLVTLGRVPLKAYVSFRDSQDVAPREKRKSPSGNFYTTKVRDLGKGYVRQVTSAHRRTAIDTTTAANYLDVKVGQIAGLAKAAQVAS
jgi:Zn-dependent peptidase ImmA (M78 family)